MKAGIVISKAEVEKIAHLARLKIPDNKMDELQAHFNKIIQYFKDIEKVDTAGVRPMVTPHEIEVSLREDLVMKNLSVEEILQNAPDVKDSLFKVPPVV